MTFSDIIMWVVAIGVIIGGIDFMLGNKFGLGGKFEDGFNSMGPLAIAMAGIVVAADTSVIDTWQCDAAIAAQNIWLAAADQGLGACWCHVYQREGAEDLVRKLTNLPENYTILCVISLGYKNEERKPFDFEKLQYDKVVQID